MWDKLLIEVSKLWISKHSDCSTIIKAKANKLRKHYLSSHWICYLLSYNAFWISEIDVYVIHAKLNLSFVWSTRKLFSEHYEQPLLSMKLILQFISYYVWKITESHDSFKLKLNLWKFYVDSIWNNESIIYLISFISKLSIFPIIKHSKTNILN